MAQRQILLKNSSSSGENSSANRKQKSSLKDLDYNSKDAKSKVSTETKTNPVAVSSSKANSKPRTKPRNKDQKGRRRQFSHGMNQTKHYVNIQDGETSSSDESSGKYSKRIMEDNSSRYEKLEVDSEPDSSSSESFPDLQKPVPAKSKMETTSTALPDNFEDEVGRLLSVTKSSAENQKGHSLLNFVPEDVPSFSSWLENLPS